MWYFRAQAVGAGKGKKPVRGYVSEKRRWKRKGNIPSQVFEEACVLFDPREELRIYACRGGGLTVGQGLDTALELSREEAAFLRERAPRSPLSLACGRERGLLVFSALYEDTGLLLGILPGADLQAVCAAGQAELLQASVSPTVQERWRRGEAQGEINGRWLAAGIAAIAHTLRWLQPDTVLPWGKRLQWMAGFSRCPAELSADTVRGEPSTEERGRWIAYLLCLFLTLGNGGSGPSLDGGKGPIKVGDVLRLEWQTSASRPRVRRHSEAGEALSGPLFLERPCFRDFALIQREDGLFLTVPVAPSLVEIRSRHRQTAVCAVLSIRFADAR